MATGSGKTYTAVNFIYRLVKYAGAKRILFLVDRGNLGDQTLKEFQQFVSPVNNYKFTEEYIVQRLSSNQLDTSARVVIGTIQRIYSMLKGETETAPDLDDLPIESAETLFKQPVPVEYNPAFPIEEFDFIVTDECHRSIYNLWRQVLDYFDASLIGLTATPSKQTFGFFQQNLVMEYNHEKAVADGVNVGCDIYRIKTQITEGGSKVDAGLWVDKRDRQTRKVRWEQLDEVLAYDASDLDRDVVATDQIRTVLETFRDKVFTEMFPGRTDLPKTLIFANVLFEGGAGETIRRELLKQADVHTLLRLPTGIFYAQGVKANVLFFDRKPAQEKPWTEKLWIYDLRTNKHFTLKENTLKRSDLDEFVACYFGRAALPRRQGSEAEQQLRPTSRHQRTESERFKAFAYDELLKRDKVNLDIFWLKDEALEDSANLPAPEVIATDITADLEAALEQFATIAEDLKR